MTLRTAVCPKDMVAQTLCTKCRQLLEKGEISELDVTVSHRLGQLSKTFPLTNVEFKKAIDLDQFVILACTGRIGSLIGSRGKIVSEISKGIGKTVRIIEHSKNEKKMAQDLVGDARVLGLKKIFSPQSTQYRVVVSGADRQKLIAPQKKLEEGLEKLFSAQAVIEFI
jgi:transcription antitermination factor NusA-like protein